MCLPKVSKKVHMLLFIMWCTTTHCSALSCTVVRCKTRPLARCTSLFFRMNGNELPVTAKRSCECPLEFWGGIFNGIQCRLKSQHACSLICTGHVDCETFFACSLLLASFVVGFIFLSFTEAHRYVVQCASVITCHLPCFFSAHTNTAH